MPSMGVSYSKNFLDEPSSVPSPPNTINKSILVTKSSDLSFVIRLLVTSASSSIKILSVYFERIGNSESRNKTSPSS